MMTATVEQLAEALARRGYRVQVVPADGERLKIPYLRIWRDPEAGYPTLMLFAPGAGSGWRWGECGLSEDASVEEILDAVVGPSSAGA